MPLTAHAKTASLHLCPLLEECEVLFDAVHDLEVGEVVVPEVDALPAHVALKLAVEGETFR